ncbi:MAG: GTP 3',8-cyclase MoaA [Deltaproteobacteria bacterium]|nr:MAG: GTP 3',8-cyclase MoaA [Deltaproteobacteria bacterium]
MNRASAYATPRDLPGRPLRDLRISVTDRCNFRCPYCMPAEVFGKRYTFVPKPELLSFEEMARLAGCFVALGARKIRITGGEPLVRAELPALIERLAGIPGLGDLALTTNGYLLADSAQDLRDAGLRRITVSLDSLDEAIYRRMNGRHYGTARVLAGIAAAERAGLRPIKVNCVVQRGVNDGSIVELARYFKGTGHIVRFIEYMDVGNRNQWNLSEVVPAAEIVERIHAELPLRPATAHYRGEVASRFEYLDGGGEIGVISSVSAPFCGDCTRARLSPEGQLITCLFATEGIDLRKPLRAGCSDAELRDQIAAVWRRRSDRYSEERAAHLDLEGHSRSRSKIEMHRIGG